MVNSFSSLRLRRRSRIRNQDPAETSPDWGQRQAARVGCAKGRTSAGEGYRNRLRWRGSWLARIRWQTRGESEGDDHPSFYLIPFPSGVGPPSSRSGTPVNWKRAGRAGGKRGRAKVWHLDRGGGYESTFIESGTGGFGVRRGGRWNCTRYVSLWI